MNGYLKLARNVSLYSTYRYRVGAVIVNKKPISVGFNQVKTHPTYSNKLRTTVHAEMNAVIHSHDNIFGASIFVFREDRNGFPAIARPCKDCLETLKKAGIKKMTYSINEYPYYRTERI